MKEDSEPQIYSFQTSQRAELQEFHVSGDTFPAAQDVRGADIPGCEDGLRVSSNRYRTTSHRC